MTITKKEDLISLIGPTKIASALLAIEFVGRATYARCEGMKAGGPG